MKLHIWISIAIVAAFAAVMPRSAYAQMPNAYGTGISVEAARKIAATAAAEGKKNGWNVAVAIVDTAGDLVYFERADNTQAASINVAQDKARTAVRFKRPSKVFEDALVGGRQAILGLPGVVPIEGGIPLLIDNKIVGAIGVSGATSQQDGICSQAGADTLGKQPAMAPPPTAAKPATPPPAPPKK